MLTRLMYECLFAAGWPSGAGSVQSAVWVLRPRGGGEPGPAPSRCWSSRCSPSNDTCTRQTYATAPPATNGRFCSGQRLARDSDTVCSTDWIRLTLHLKLSQVLNVFNTLLYHSELFNCVLLSLSAVVIKRQLRSVRQRHLPLIFLYLNLFSRLTLYSFHPAFMSNITYKQKINTVK